MKSRHTIGLLACVCTLAILLGCMSPPINCGFRLCDQVNHDEYRMQNYYDQLHRPATSMYGKVPYNPDERVRTYGKTTDKSPQHLQQISDQTQLADTMTISQLNEDRHVLLDRILISHSYAVLPLSQNQKPGCIPQQEDRQRVRKHLYKVPTTVAQLCERRSV